MAEKQDDDERFLNPSTSIETEWMKVQPGFHEVRTADFGDDAYKPEKVLELLTRDIRLGNFTRRNHDLRWIEDQLSLAQHLLLLRGGVFKKSAIAVMSTVASVTEVSQGIEAKIRTLQRTVHKTEQSTFSDESRGGGIFNMGKKNNSYGG